MKSVLIDNINRFAHCPNQFTRCSYSDAQKQKLIEYMRSFEPCCSIGLVDDCVTGEELTFENVGADDGEFMWDTQSIYHIETYNAAVTAEFFEKVMYHKR